MNPYVQIVTWASLRRVMSLEEEIWEVFGEVINLAFLAPDFEYLALS